MARLSMADADAVRAAAKSIRNEVQHGYPLMQIHGRFDLQGSILRISEEGLEIPFDYRNVRAKMSALSGGITLAPMPMMPAEYAALTDYDGFEDWLAHVLAHEICHFIQRRDAGRRWSGPHGWAKASHLNVVARATDDHAKYLDYVEHPLEMEAHATQMAMQVLTSQTGRLSEVGFRAAAASSHMARHVSDHPDSSAATKAALEIRIDKVLQTMIDDAWYAYDAIA